LTPILDANSTLEPLQAWYALYTRHQQENNVARSLSGKGFEVFLPLYTAIHRWNDPDEKRSLPPAGRR
jgi:hypothetical protein